MTIFKAILELASGVVERAVKDFVQCGWKLKHTPEPEIKKGTKYCKYQETKRDFGTAKSFLEDPVGLIQEIFGIHFQPADTHCCHFAV